MKPMRLRNTNRNTRKAINKPRKLQDRKTLKWNTTKKLLWVTEQGYGKIHTYMVFCPVAAALRRDLAGAGAWPACWLSPPPHSPGLSPPARSSLPLCTLFQKLISSMYLLGPFCNKWREAQYDSCIVRYRRYPKEYCRSGLIMIRNFSQSKIRKPSSWTVPNFLRQYNCDQRNIVDPD